MLVIVRISNLYAGLRFSSTAGGTMGETLQPRGSVYVVPVKGPRLAP